MFAVLLGVLPPNVNALVTVPEDAFSFLAVLISDISVQEDPFHCSTLFIFAGGSSLPPIQRAAVLVPFVI